MKQGSLIAAVCVAWMLSVVTVFVLARLMPLSVRQLQTGVLTVGGGSGEGRVIVTTEPDGGPRFLMYDANRMLVCEVSSTPQGAATRFTLNGADGKPLTRMEVTGQGRPRLQILNAADGKPVWSVTTDDSGAPSVGPP